MQVSVWSVLTGVLVRIYRDVHPSEITSFYIDNLQQRFMVGCADGTVKVGQQAVYCLPVIFFRSVLLFLAAITLNETGCSAWKHAVDQSIFFSQRRGAY